MREITGEAEKGAEGGARMGIFAHEARKIDLNGLSSLFYNMTYGIFKVNSIDRSGSASWQWLPIKSQSHRVESIDYPGAW